MPAGSILATINGTQPAPVCSPSPCPTPVPTTQVQLYDQGLQPLVTDGLAAHVAVFGTGPDGLLFHQQDGGPVRRGSASRYMRMACAQAGLGGHGWHDLRHHHASVLLSEGVSPALVAERLGHSIAELLATYAHVIRKDEDRVRDIVDNTLGGSAEDWLRTEAV